MSKSKYNVALLPGDGIGLEVTHAAVAVLDAVAEGHGLAIGYTTYEAGAELYKKSGVSMSEADMAALASADAILLGAMGLRPQLMGVARHSRKFRGCLRVRMFADVPYHADIWRLSAAARVVLSEARGNIEYSLRLLRYAGIDLPERGRVAQS